MQFFTRFYANLMRMGPVQRQSLLTLASMAGVSAVGYLATIYFAHSLGPGIMGLYFTFLAYYGIFDLIGDGGLGSAAAKRISEGKEQNEYYSAYVALRCLLLVISVLFCILFFPYLPGLQGSGILPWMLLALVIGTVYSITSTNIYGTAQVGIVQAGNFLNTLAKIIVQIAAVFIGFGIGGLVAGYVTGMAAGLLINTRFVRLSFTRFSRGHIRALFSFSFWTFLSSGGALAFSYADTILIGIFMTQADVGIYRVAYQLAAVSAIVVTAFHTTLFPRISQWHAENCIAPIESALSKSLTYCLILTIPIAVGGALLARPLMYFLYSEAFESGDSVLVVLLLVQIANIFMFLFTMSLNAMDRPRDSFMVTAISAILNIVLNILLIPLFGIVGAGCATLLSVTVNAVLAYRILRPMIRLHVAWATCGYILLASAVMAGAVMLYTYLFGVGSVWSLIAAILIGAAVYFAVLLRLDEPIRTEIVGLMVSMDVPLARK